MARVRASASAFMNPTINTAPVSTSWVTTGISPSLVKVNGGASTALTAGPAFRARRELFRVGDPEFAEVEDGGGEHGVGPTRRERLHQMIEIAGAAGGDHRNVDPRADCRQQARRRSRPCAVAIHAGDSSSPAPRSAGAFRPLDRVEPGRLAARRGCRRPSRALPSRRASIATTMHWRPNRSAPATIRSGLGIAAVLIETLSAPARSNCRDIFGRANASADRQRNENCGGGAFDDVDHGVARIGAGGDVEENKLVGAFGVVKGGELDRIAGVAKIDELDALDDPPVGHIETGDDAAGQRIAAHRRAFMRARPTFARRALPRSSTRPS